MKASAWAVPGDLDAGTWFGEQFSRIYDRLVPGGESAEQAADFLIGLVGRADPVAIEFGVGTGRIALPLARRGALVTGVDSSPLMLDACRAAVASEGVDLRFVEADMRDWLSHRRADLAYCVGGAFTYLPTAQDQVRAMRVIAGTVRPGGTVVVENHNPAYVRLMHEYQDAIKLTLPMAGAPENADALSLLDEEDGIWQVEYRWTDADGVSGTAIERSLLTEHDELERMAGDAGLEWRATYRDWVGTPGQTFSPSYVCVFSAPKSGSTV